MTLKSLKIKVKKKICKKKNFAKLHANPLNEHIFYFKSEKSNCFPQLL